MDFSPIVGRDVSSKKPIECLFMVEKVSSGIFFGRDFSSDILWWTIFFKQSLVEVFFEICLVEIFW